MAASTTTPPGFFIPTETFMGQAQPGFILQGPTAFPHFYTPAI